MKAEKTNKSFRLICRVLLCISDNLEPVNVKQIMEQTGLTYQQVRKAVYKLRIQEKIYEAKVIKREQFFAFNEDFTPPKRDPIVKAKTPAAKAHYKREPTCIVERYRFVNQKIALLRRLLKIVNSDDDRDLIEGIIRDYDPNF